MIRILSTKRLLPNQKQFLLNAGFSVIESDFIQTKNTKADLEDIKDNLIFTSQNAIRSVLAMKESSLLKNKDCFCVGFKSKSLLERNGFKVIAATDYAKELAEVISNEYQHRAFTFFSGNLRQDTLPDSMQNKNINFNEIEVYKTVLMPNKINTFIDGILFFSPSGVESYLISNSIIDQTCFCIGITTAKALENETRKVVIANQPSVENVIIQTIKHYKA